MNNLDYDTDEEETNNIRVIYTWNFEINYEYFNINNINVFINKNEIFKKNLKELKEIRNTKNNINRTGEIFKFCNEINLKVHVTVHIYFIAYYDNTKVSIDFYGLFNEEICEKKLIENIQIESTYGKNGTIYKQNQSNLDGFDFVIINKKISIL